MVALTAAAPHKAEAPHKGAPHRVASAVGWAGALLVASTLSLRYAGRGGQLQVVGLDFGVSLLSSWLVGRAATGLPGAVGQLLACRPMTAIGRGTRSRSLSST